MPLRKIWNSLCGKSVSEAPKAKQRATERSTERPSSPSSTPSEKPSKANADASQGRGVLSMARRAVGLQRGPHAALLRQISKRRPTRILELGIGNGSRAAAILAEAPEDLEFTYIVVDQFEMAGGEVTLRDFHAKVSAASAQRRPCVIPEPIASGLETVANRFGYIDLILVSDSNLLDEATSRLPRVAGDSTCVLVLRGEEWELLDQAAASRRAA